MSARRLNDSEKREIVELYRESGETAISLAEQFGVSNTTISRILKAGMTSHEYDRLVQQKRRGSESNTLDITIPSLAEPDAIEEPIVPQIPSLEAFETREPDEFSSRRLRRRSSSSTAQDDRSTPAPTQSSPLSSSNFPLQTRLLLPDAFAHEDPIDSPNEDPNEAFAFEERLTYDRPEPSSSNKPVRKVIQVGIDKRSAPEALPEALDDLDDETILPPVTEEIAAILEEDFDDADEEDSDEDDDTEDEDTEDEDDGDAEMHKLHLQRLMQVMPLSQASMPRTCYVVVDRAAELVLRPIQDFGELGSLPATGEQILTLPVFDSPRGAKRFSNSRTERVIKVPDSQIFHKAADRLRMKGVTYLFLDGQLYSL